MIYFIQDEGANLIKIGYTGADDAEVRLRTFRTGNPAGLQLLCMIPGERPKERELHDRFATARANGEWFRPVPALVRFIAENYPKPEPSAEVAPLPVPDVAPPAYPWPLKIYLAGKIKKNCWRHSIVDGLDKALPEMTTCPSGMDAKWPVPCWPILRRAVFGEHDYVGPFFASCDHGCFHGPDNHGLGAGEVFFNHYEHGRTVVPGLCLEAVAQADIVFAWIDSPDCYGTVAELGYAKAAGKRVWIAGPEYYQDMWFVYQLADEGYLLKCQETIVAANALDQLLCYYQPLTVPQANHESGDRPLTWEPPTSPSPAARVAAGQRPSSAATVNDATTPERGRRADATAARPGSC